MKHTIKAMGVLAVLVIWAQGALASARQSLLERIQPGVHYRLTPAAAKELSIDLVQIAQDVGLQSTESLAFQATEDGDIDLSIYENGSFLALRADIVK